MITETDTKWASSFATTLSLMTASARLAGRTAMVALYAAGLHMLRRLHDEFDLTEEEVRDADKIANELKK